MMPAGGVGGGSSSSSLDDGTPVARLPTAWCFDTRHELHAPEPGLPHKPVDYLALCHEVPERARALYEALRAEGLVDVGDERCLRVAQAEATDAELRAPALGGATNCSELFHTSAVHGADHVAGLEFTDPASYCVDGTVEAARVAAGGVLAVTRAVCLGQAANAFAIVRPPGHHACTGCGCVQGFCVFNNVAVAAANARLPAWYASSGAGGAVPPRRILVLDFDVHHGDGVQQIFYRDRGVLYISIHRGAFDAEGLDRNGRDKGFFPGTGLAAETGDADGAGFNVNIPFEEVGMGDAEYELAFERVVMPIARSYAPDLVFICAGFDAAAGDTKSQAAFALTPACFGYMVRQALTLAQGHVVVALEGGYDVGEICAGGVEVMRALQGQEGPVPGSVGGGAAVAACAHAVDTIQRVVTIQAEFWACLRTESA